MAAKLRAARQEQEDLARDHTQRFKKLAAEKESKAQRIAREAEEARKAREEAEAEAERQRKASQESQRLLAIADERALAANKHRLEALREAEAAKKEAERIKRSTAEMRAPVLIETEVPTRLAPLRERELTKKEKMICNAIIGISSLVIVSGVIYIAKTIF